MDRNPAPARFRSTGDRGTASPGRNAGARRARSKQTPSVGRPPLIAGVGASAGGLEAFSRLLQTLPAHTELACVLVQHLAPTHKSILPQLLAGKTHLPVVEASDGDTVEPGTIYIMPPNVRISLQRNTLRLSNRNRPAEKPFSPIDWFLSSLAREAGPRAAAVVLSGNGSDGASGATEVKRAGGTVLVQDPSTAAHDGMPRATIGSGTADAVLPPEAIAERLHLLAGSTPHRGRKGPAGDAASATAKPADQPPVTDEQFQKIFALLRQSSGVDFSCYKTGTLRRRLQRRMTIQKLPTVDRYIERLRQDRTELDALYRDVLIHVTRFFREPESFRAITTSVFPKILDAPRGDGPVRVWIPGCSTGEEAYSVAIALLEFVGERRLNIPVQIFATDVSEDAVNRAREGVYPSVIEADVSPERLSQFFTRVPDSPLDAAPVPRRRAKRGTETQAKHQTRGSSDAPAAYRVSKAVRDLCVFARQDLTRDPPFSKLDLIMCRNVLIYLAQPQQRRIMSIFHYALRPAGFLILGASETTGPQADLFTLADKKFRFYKKKVEPGRPGLDLQPAPPVHRAGGTPLVERAPAEAGKGPRARGSAVSASKPTLDTIAGEILLDRYTPPAVVVDATFQIVQSRGRTSPFLRLAPGGASLSIVKMAKEGLVYGLRSALSEARKRNTVVRRENLRVEQGRASLDVAVDVVPIGTGGSPGGKGSPQPHYLVVFRTKPTAPARPPKGARALGGAAERAKSQRLQRELDSTREYLQSIIQDLEAANEELRSSNEEILSSNEELQSTNEELDTAKEELQSTNEEIITVNDELQSRNEELGRANSDLVNLLGAVNIAVVIADRGLRIRRFTPMAERILNLIPGDSGRPIGHIRSELDIPDLETLISRCIEDVVPIEKEVLDRSGNWYNMRLRPYKNSDNRIDGAVLTLYDISAAKRIEASLTAAAQYAEAIVETIREPLVVMDSGLRVRSVNTAFSAAFRIPQAAAQGRYFYELGDGQWNQPELRTRLEGVLAKDARFEDLMMEAALAGIGHRRLSLSARRIEGTSSRPPLILLAIQEVSGEAPGPHRPRTPADPGGSGRTASSPRNGDGDSDGEGRT